MGKDYNILTNMVEKKVQVTTDIETNWFESVDNFNDLNLNEDLLRGIYGYGYEKPSII